jgi:trk system potassium uptake protein TrkH
MNYKIVIKVLAFLSIFLGLGMLLPLPFCYYYGSGDAQAFLISAAICFSIGILAFLNNDKKTELKTRDGFAIVTFGWIIMALLGSLPYMLSGAIPSFADAFFESMSGFTTTGSTILTEIESLPQGILLWRSTTHWFGGMGIIVLTIAILPFLGIGGMSLFKAESPGPISDKLKPRITQTAKLLWAVYLILTVTQLSLLMVGGMDFFHSLNHSFATMATGGFSTKNLSLAGETPYTQYIVIIFMFLAGTNFSLHYHWMRGDFKSVYKSTEFRVYVFIILFSSTVIFTDVYQIYAGAVEPAIRDVLFHVVTVITTTGFATSDFEMWSTSSQVMTLALMFVGGMAGSTSGGMKVIRVILLFKFAYNQFVKVLHPRAIVPIKVGNTRIEDKVIHDVLGFFVLYVFIIAVSIYLLILFGLDLESAIGSAVTSINNIGPGLNLTGPTKNFGFLPDISKWLLSFLMLVGRLEVLTVIILLAPSYWKK